MAIYCYFDTNFYSIFFFIPPKKSPVLTLLQMIFSSNLEAVMAAAGRCGNRRTSACLGKPGGPLDRPASTSTYLALVPLTLASSYYATAMRDNTKSLTFHS